MLYRQEPKVREIWGVSKDQSPKAIDHWVGETGASLDELEPNMDLLESNLDHLELSRKLYISGV